MPVPYTAKVVKNRRKKDQRPIGKPTNIILIKDQRKKMAPNDILLFTFIYCMKRLF